MIAAKSSRRYTDLALDTFFKNTELSVDDEFILIDNDNERNFFGIPFLSNSTPKSFSQNCNEMIDKANGRNLFLLSNDIVFTPKWNIPLTQFSNVLIIPSCNQTHLYTSGNLQLKPSMSLEDFDNQTYELDTISRLHKSQTRMGFFENLLMGFYGFWLPAGVYSRVGYFNEQFGVGGGEDVDYRLRAIQLDIPVKYLSQSYLLHFAGKSTLDGPEQQKEIQDRNQKYFSLFSEKWGEDLANLCLVGGNSSTIIEKYQLYNLLQHREFSKAIKLVLNTWTRNKL